MMELINGLFLRTPCRCPMTVRVAWSCLVSLSVLVAVSAECDDRPVCDIFRCRNVESYGDLWRLDLPQLTDKLPCPARWAPMQGAVDKAAKTGTVHEL